MKKIKIKRNKHIWGIAALCGVLGIFSETVQGRSLQCDTLYNHLKFLKQSPIKTFPHAITLGASQGNQFQYTLDHESSALLTHLQTHKEMVMQDGKATLQADQAGGHAGWWICSFSVPTTHGPTNFVYHAEFIAAHGGGAQAHPLVKHGRMT